GFDRGRKNFPDVAPGCSRNPSPEPDPRPTVEAGGERPPFKGGFHGHRAGAYEGRPRGGAGTAQGRGEGRTQGRGGEGQPAEEGRAALRRTLAKLRRQGCREQAALALSVRTVMKNLVTWLGASARFRTM